MITTVGRWLIECDPEATRRCYAKIPPGVGCDCAPCRNVETLGPAAFPENALAVFEELGIDFHKPVEVFHIAKLNNGLHLYGGWYHCVGHIISGPETDQTQGPSRGVEQSTATAIKPLFTLSFSSQRDLLQEPFRDFDVVEVDFSAELPWVLSEPEPD